MFRSNTSRSAVRHSYYSSCLALFALLFTTAFAAAEPRRSSSNEGVEKESKARCNCLVEVRFTDNSVMKLTINEERIGFTTAYGKLYIPTTEIRRIEFGLRIPEETAKRIEAALADLGNMQFRRREAASAILLALREKAFPAVLKATKHADMEIANRAEELLKKLRESVPEELLKLPEYDIIHTETSKIAGTIDSSVLRANTIQFGDVQLRLADVFVLSSKGTADIEAEAVTAVAGPINMLQHQNETGKTFVFKVTGTTNGSIWGTDIYTTDSTLGVVAVHAGLLQPGQPGVVKVTVIPSPNLFIGSTRNGVTSSPYQQFPMAYRVHK